MFSKVAFSCFTTVGFFFLPCVWVRSRHQLCPAAPLRRWRPDRSSCRYWPGCLPAARRPSELRPRSLAPPPACSSSGTRRCNHPGRGSWLVVEDQWCLLTIKQMEKCLYVWYVLVNEWRSMLRRNRSVYWHFFLEQTKLWSLWHPSSFHLPVTR